MQLFKHNNLINDIDVSKINNINNVVFETTKSVYSVDDAISKRIRDEISDEEYDKIIESFKPSCQMKNLADNNVVLCRFAKSNTSVAERSIEGHDYIKHNEHRIANAISYTQKSMNYKYKGPSGPLYLCFHHVIYTIFTLFFFNFSNNFNHYNWKADNFYTCLI